MTNSLTPRQQRAYDLRRSGMKIREIARDMKTTPEQVRQLLARAMRKMGFPVDEYGGY